MNDLILWDNGALTRKDFENGLNKQAQTLGLSNAPSSDIFMLAGRLLGVGYVLPSEISFQFDCYSITILV